MRIGLVENAVRGTAVVAEDGERRVRLCDMSNWPKENLRAARRSKFMCMLLSVLRKVKIDAPGSGDVEIGDASSLSIRWQLVMKRRELQGQSS